MLCRPRKCHFFWAPLGGERHYPNIWTVNHSFNKSFFYGNISVGMILIENRRYKESKIPTLSYICTHTIYLNSTNICFSIYYCEISTSMQWLSEMYCSASHQLKLNVRWVDAAEHGNMLGGQLWREHTSPDSCHSSHAANTPHAPAGRGHLLQHRAWHLENRHNGRQAHLLPQKRFGAVTSGNCISLAFLPNQH